MLSNILYILLALVVLMVLITVHEFGHYVSGKILGFKINEFAIGFGPAIFKKVNKKTGEIFSIRLLPLGGYCAFEGEDEENPGVDAFNNQKPWKRLIVLISGVLFNFIFGIITASIFLGVNGYGVPCIVDFAPDSVNASILQKGDIIQEINGESIEAYRGVSDIMQGVDKTKPLVFTIVRNGEVMTIENVQFYKGEAYYYVAKSNIENKIFDNGGIPWDVEEFQEYIKTIKPVYNETTKTYEKFTHDDFFYKADGSLYTDEQLIEVAGITLSPKSTSPGFIYSTVQARYSFFECLGKAWPFCFYICGLILSALGGLFTGATALADMGGTITAIGQIAEVSKMGLNSFLLLFPMLSMNLALFNILPIPALDGARCVFVLIEWIFRKPVPRKIENRIHTIGLFVLFAFVIFLDVYHIFILPRIG